MTDMKFIPILTIIVVSSLFLGCIKPEETAGTPAPEATTAVTPALEPTIIPTLVPTPTPLRQPLEYRFDVDSDYGFYRVVIVNSTLAAPYENNTLTIRTGDKVIWINDATPDEKLTIVSEQNLWSQNETGAILLWNYRQFNYTFTQPGEYTFYIKEYKSKAKAHQKIIVNP